MGERSYWKQFAILKKLAEILHLQLFQAELSQSLQQLGTKVRQTTESIAALKQLQSRIDVSRNY